VRRGRLRGNRRVTLWREDAAPTPPQENRMRHLPAWLLGAALAGAALAAAPARAATLHLDVAAERLDSRALTTVLTARSSLARAGVVELALAVPRDRDEEGRGRPERAKGVSTYDLLLHHDAERGLVTFSLVGEAELRRDRRRDPETVRISESARTGALDFNLMSIFAMATTPGTTLAFSDLFFEPGEGLATEGVLETMGRVEQSGMESYGQWMGAASGTNLARFDWTIGAHVTMRAGDGGTDAGGGVTFGFAGLRGAFAPPDLTEVPEPATIAMFGIGLAALGFAQLRRGRDGRTERRRPAGGSRASAAG
jgi:hypothetical protein